jgi:hypothetical protein
VVVKGTGALSNGTLGQMQAQSCRLCEKESMPLSADDISASHKSRIVGLCVPFRFYFHLMGLLISTMCEQEDPRKGNQLPTPSCSTAIGGRPDQIGHTVALAGPISVSHSPFGLAAQG